jgi:hypothetical protein
MKRASLFFAVILLLATTCQLMAQRGNFSAGVFTTIQNYQRDNLSSQINNPIGYGIVLHYSLHKQLALQASGVYTQGSIEGNRGTEKNIQGKGAILYYPVEMGILRPYLLGGFGIVTNSRNLNGSGKTNGSNIYSEYGVGTDIKVFKPLSLNINFSFYNDGFGFTGHGSTLGFRFNL